MSINFKRQSFGLQLNFFGMRKIFNKFYTTKGKRNGSGMGLSIVKNVLEEHQGKIDLKSDAISTRFIIKFNRIK